MSGISTSPLAVTSRPLIVGIGNPDRGDDGIGPMVVQRLAALVPPDVKLIQRPGDALALIEDWSGHDIVILVDAAAPGPDPGRIHRLDLLLDALPAEIALSSTHAFGIADAAGLARALGLLPGCLIAYAVEGADFSPGAPVTHEVAAAIDDVVERVLAELRTTRELGHA